MSIELMMPTNHLILCHPLLLLPSVFPSIRVFSSKSVLHIRWPKYWCFSFSKSPSNEYSGLVFFRIDWFDLVVQGTLKSLLSTTIQKPQFFGASLLYGPTLISLHEYLKTIPLTTWTFFSKVVSLLFNMLSRFVIAFLPGSSSSASHSVMSSFL